MSMSKNYSTIILAIIITSAIALLAPVTAKAQDEAAKAKAQIANDQENFYGDRLGILVNMKAQKIIPNPPPKTVDVCIPGGTTMVVIGQQKKDNTIMVILNSTETDCYNSGGGKQELDTKTAFIVNLDDLRNSGFTRTGITYGTLVVPFKYQLTGDKDFTGSATLGGYVGFRYETRKWIGITLTPILFVGASSNSVQNSSKSSTDNIMGFSYGGGLIGTIKSSFQVGIVIGADIVGNSVNYQYNGKPWIALEIGFSFLQ
jgi:hypothetical protein